MSQLQPDPLKTVVATAELQSWGQSGDAIVDW